VLGQQFRQSLATMVIVIIALIGFMYLIVTRPLAHFIRITRAIDNGDLDKRVNLTHKDEIGELGASFDRMVESMAARTQELEKLNEIAATQITERKRAEEEMVIISAIGTVIGSTLDINEVYERFAAEARKLIPFDRLAVNLHDLDQGIVSIVYSSGENIAGRRPGDSFPLKDSVSEVLVRTKAGIFSHPSSIEAMDKQFPKHSATIQAGMRSLLSVPLISRDKVIASLHFRSRKPNAYTDRDLRLAERIGEQIAGAIANAQLFNDLIKTEKTLRESEEEQRLLIETLPLAVFVETHGKIAYVNPAFLTLFKASSPKEVIGIRLIEFVSPELYDTIEKRRRIMTEEKCVLPPLEQNLRCMDGTFITVVSTPMPFIFQEQPAILTVLYDITERKRSEIELEKTYKLLQIHNREIEDLQAKLKEQTIRDPLTGLFNRRYLEETMGRELARASREGFPIGVVMIDIDHFKQVNDSHGHKAGDLILQAMGNLLLGVIRAGDIACRYGGEEFLLILPQASRVITAERAEEWRTGFEALRTVYGENALQATISLGIAAYPADGVTAEAVIHAADQAMFRAKALGRNRVVLS
jgi:diguanylate cyclase (GGDEF)-like protein/PAS domain S-box-containing protein